LRYFSGKMGRSWKPVAGFTCILLLLAAVLAYTYKNISTLKEELSDRKNYDREIQVINRLLVQTEEYYSNSNRLAFSEAPVISSTLTQQSDAIGLTIRELDSLTVDKSYASLVDSVNMLYTGLQENMSTLIRFREVNDFSFDAPLLKFIAEVADSLRKDKTSMQLTTVKSTMIIVEKPVVVEVKNQKKNRRNKKGVLPVRPDSLLPSVTDFHQTDTLLKDSTFLSKVDSTFNMIGSEINRIKSKTEKKQQQLARKYAELEAVKNHLFQQITTLLQKIRQAEQQQADAKIRQASDNADHTFSSLVTLFIVAGVFAIVFFVMIIYDITRSNYYRKRLEMQKTRAEKLAKDKEDFLATMSHEIRTPLNAIIGFTHLLRENVAPQDLTRYVEQIDRSAEHLLTLVTQTLDHTKLENGTAEPRPADFNLNECLMEVIGPAEVLAKAKRLSLRHHLQPVPFLLHGDAAWLRQILYNLVGNSIKYTASGSVTIRSGWRMENDQVTLELRITDTGEGIPKELQASLFEAYKQLPTASSSSGGTGLGLSITQKLVELQKGTIGVESEPGQGTTFIVTLPYRKGSGQIQSLQKKPVHIPDLQGQNILLVDDDEPSLLLLRLLLERWNAKVTLAKSLSEATECIHNKMYSSIIMDWNLGDGTAETLLSDPGGKLPLVIISSGDDSLKRMVTKYRHLQLRFIPKPIDPGTLASCLDAPKTV